MEKSLNQQTLVQRKNRTIKKYTQLFITINLSERLFSPCLAYTFFPCSMFICENGFHVDCSLFHVWHFVSNIMIHNFAHIHNIRVIQHPNTKHNEFDVHLDIFFSCTDYRAPNKTWESKYKIHFGFTSPIFTHSLHLQHSLFWKRAHHFIEYIINKMHKYSKLERCFFAFIGIFSFISLFSFSFSIPFLFHTANYNIVFFSSFVRHQLRG